MIPLFSIPSIHRNVERQQKVRFQMIRALTRGIRSRKIRISRTEEQRVHLQHEMADVIWMIKPYDSSVGDYRFFNEDEKKQIIEAVGKKVGEKNSDFFYGGDHFNVFHENEEVFTAFVDVAEKIIKNATVDQPVFLYGKLQRILLVFCFPVCLMMMNKTLRHIMLPIFEIKSIRNQLDKKHQHRIAVLAELARGMRRASGGEQETQLVSSQDHGWFRLSSFSDSDELIEVDGKVITEGKDLHKSLYELWLSMLQHLAYASITKIKWSRFTFKKDWDWRDFETVRGFVETYGFEEGDMDWIDVYFYLPKSEIMEYNQIWNETEFFEVNPPWWAK